MFVDPENPAPAEDAAPRAIVPGSSPFASVAATLVANGFSAIPIKPQEKMPGDYKRGEWYVMRDWSRFCSKLPTEFEVKHWSSWPDTNVGIACGRGLLAFDIDRDDLVDPILAVLPPAMVAKKGRKGLTIFYQGDTSVIRSRGFSIDKIGCMDLISDGKQTVIPPSIHRDTGTPYEWTTARTLLDTRLDELPTIDESHVEAVIEVLIGFGYEAEPTRIEVERSPAPFRAGNTRPRSRDINERALANLHAWVPALGLRKLRRQGGGYRAVAEWTPSGSGKPLGKRERTLSVHSKGIVDFGDGDRRYTPLDLVMAARGVEYGEARLWLAGCLGIDLATPIADQSDGEPCGPAPIAHPRLPVAAEATYADDALPLADAEAAVARLVGEFFEREVPTFKGARTLYELKHPTNPIVLPPEPCGVALRIEAGIGKTEEAICAIAAALRVGLSIVYAVPTVELADQLVERFQKVGVDARVWRGREKPIAPGSDETMCRDLQAVADAVRAGARYIARAVCSAKLRGGAVRQCQHFDVCGHMRQKSAEPTIWIVTHAMLFNSKPGAIPKADALVIDESFYGNAIPDKPAVLAVDAIERAGLPNDFATARTLQRARRALVDALRQAADGPFSRAALDAAGITPEMAREAKKLERGRFVEPAIVPGQAPKARAERADNVADTNRQVKLLAGLWAEIAMFLDGDFAASGRLTLAQDANGARIVRRRSLKPLHEDWRCPTLILDATAPPAEILSIVLDMPVEMRASIRAQWHAIGHVRQVIGGPQSSNALGANGQGGGKRSIAALARYVALRASQAFPARVGVVIQKDLNDRLEAHGLGPNVEVRHFGALAGLDHWRDFGGVILIGRTAPAPGSMEANAGVLTGAPVEPTDEPFATGGVLLRDGSVRETDKVIRLANPVAESLRWQVCEGNLIQALGRIRPLRAHGRESFFVDVLSDVPLPIVVDEVRRWDEVRPDPYAAMAAGGVILTSAGDAAAAFGLSRQEARTLVEGATVVATPNRKTPLGISTTVVRPRRVRYKRRGRYPADVEAFVFDNGPRGTAAILAWLEEHIGPIEAIDVEHRKMSPETIARMLRSIASPYSMKAALTTSPMSRFSTLGAMKAVAPVKLAPICSLIRLPPSPFERLTALNAAPLQRLIADLLAAEKQGDADDLDEPTAA